MIDRLLKFVILVNQGSYTKAALRANISQPALTMAIQQLERELGSQLVIRSQNGLVATAAGKKAYAAGTAINGSIRSLTASLADIEQTKFQYRIGLTDSVAAHIFNNPQAVLELEQLGTLNVVVDATNTLIEMLTIGALDVVIGTETAAYSQTEIARTFIQNEELVLVCSPEQKVQREAELEAGTITNFIAYNTASNTYRLIQKQLEARAIAVEILTYSTSPDVMLGMVQNGIGVALLPVEKITNTFSSSQIHILHRLSVQRPLFLYESKHIYVPSLSAAMLYALQ